MISITFSYYVYPLNLKIGLTCVQAVHWSLVSSHSMQISHNWPHFCNLEYVTITFYNIGGIVAALPCPVEAQFLIPVATRHQQLTFILLWQVQPRVLWPMEGMTRLVRKGGCPGKHDPEELSGLLCREASKWEKYRLRLASVSVCANDMAMK